MRPSPGWRFALLVACACTGTTTVEVNPKSAPPRPTLRALRTNPSSLTLEKLGATSRIQVIGYYDQGGASVDMTAEAGFSSRDPAVVRVSPGGMLTAMTPGATVIDVTAGQLTREIDVEVLPDVLPPAWLQFFSRQPLTGLRKPAWWGETEKNATVEITGGLAPSSAKADDRGIFAIDVPLVPNRANALTITVIDANGNRSEPYAYEVEQRDTLARAGVLSHVAGNGQTGIVAKPLGAPLKVIATARGGAPLAGKKVTWRVLIGGGTIEGQREVTVLTDVEGKATALPTLGEAVGDAAHMVMASLEGDWGAPVIFTLKGVVEGSGETALSGVVLTEETSALPGVTIFLKDSRGVVLANGTTDDRGRFRLSGFAAGSGYSLSVEGATATLPGKYPDLIFDVSPLPGIDNPMSAPVILPKLPAGVQLPLDANGMVTMDLQLSTPVTARPGLPPMILKLPAGTRVTWPPNLPVADRVLRLVSVPTFGVPMPFPNGLSTQSVIAVQPANTQFSPPLPIMMPNVDGIAPGKRVPIFSFDHATREFINVGTGTVDSNGTYVVSDPGSGIRKGAWHLDPDPDPCTTNGCLNVVAPGCPTFKGSVSCTCIAAGGQSASCKPGQPVCIPNVPACGPGASTKVRIVCDGNNIDDDGSTVKITKPKNGATIPNKDPVDYVAETCPEGRENEIEWEYKEGADVKLIGEKKGPKLRLGYLKERKEELVKAKLGKARDAVTVRITDKCMDVGILTVCGEDITEIEPMSDRWKVTGTVTIGLKEKVLGIQSTNDVEIDNQAILVKGTSGGEPLVVNTTKGRIPFNYPPWELNANNGQFNIPAFITAKKADLAKWGGQVGFEKMEVIEGGVEVKAKLGIPEHKIFGNSFPPPKIFKADGFKYSIELGAVKLLEDAPIQLKGKISFGMNFGPKLPPDKLYTNDDWKPVTEETRGLKGTCEFDIPESLGCTLEVSMKFANAKTDPLTGDPYTKTAYVGADFNWKKERTTIKFGVKDWNQPIPHAVNLLAVQELGAEVAVPWDLFNQAGWEIAATTKITGNRDLPLAGRFAYDLFTIEAELRWKPFRTFSGRGKVSLFKERFPVANAGFDVNDATPLSIFGNVSLLAPVPALFKTGIEVFLSLVMDQFYNVNGGARGTLSVLGFSAEQSLRLTGAFVDDPFVDLSGAIGPFKNAVGGRVGPFTLGVRVDFHNDKVQFRTCADFQEIRSEAWAGQPVAFTITPGTDKAMIVVRRTGAVPAPFTLLKPDGSTVGTQGAFNIAYLEEPVTGNSLYFVTAPAAGTWKVVNVSSPATATRVALMLPNKPPAVSFGLLAPQSNGDVVIDYVASDPDDNAQVSLFYDADDQGFDGQAIGGALKMPELDGPGTFRWTPAGMPSGEYWVYAVVDDRHDHPTQAYSPNRVRIVDPLGPPPPTAVHAVYGSETARIDWVPSPMAARYLVRLSAPGHDALTLDVADPSAVVSALEAGATWRITITAADVNGHTGPPSDPIELSAFSAGANAPQILSTPPRLARAGMPYAYDVKATDADPASVLVYRLGAAPAGASIDPMLGTFRWTPAAAQTGTARVELVVEDQTRRRATQRFDVQVTSAALANVSPELISPAPTIAQPGQAFAHTVKAVDADGTPLVYALQVAPPGMTLAPGTGAIAWAPALQHFANGPVPVVVTATDPDGAVATQRWVLASLDSDGDGLRDSYERGAGLDPLKTDTDADGTPDGMEDADGDGLTALAEQTAGTSATQLDSDGDGLSDGDEVNRTRSNPLVVDTDGDNLSDSDEAMRATDPTKTDSDGDGAKDGDEVAAGTNPLMNAGDADLDGLSDDLEKLIGTSPSSSDTDGDMLSDAYERQAGSNPLSKDTDGDGASDAVDAHPLERRDSDGDGLSDDLEGFYKTNPLEKDTDHDGVGDAAEVLAGLNPLDATDNGGPVPRSDGLTGESLSVQPVPEGITDLGFVTLGRDRDLDGIPDTWELAHGLDPNNAADALLDADGDGVNNVTEYRLQLNPKLADTDGDGVSDSVELQQATDPRDPNSNRKGVTLIGLSVAPATLKLVINQVQGPRAQQLKVTGTFSDGSTADLSGAATGTQYASSNPGRLAVSADGLLMPVQGPDATATVTVTNGAFSQLVTVQVTTFVPRPLSATPLPLGWYPAKIVAGNRRAYVATDQGVAIFDTSTPTAPRLVSTVPGQVNGLTLAGNTLYLATEEGVTFVDVSDPQVPLQVGRVPTASRVMSIAASGGYTYAWSSGLQVIATRLPTSASLEDADGDGTDDRIVNTVMTGGFNPLVNGPVMWIGDTFYDLSTGAMPQPRGTIAGCTGKGTELYATAAVGFCGSGLQTIDFTNLAAPVVVGSLFDITSGAGNALTTTGDLALISDSSLGSGLRIYSLANFRAPAFVTTLDFTPLSPLISDANSIAADGNLVYGAESTGHLLVGQLLEYSDNGVTPPLVRIDSPRPTDRVKGTQRFTVTVTATDDVGVAAVELFADGLLVGRKTAPPWSFSVEAPKISGTSVLQLEARATDFGGNAARTQSSVIVDGDRTPPSLTFVSPLDGQLLYATAVDLIATAVDDVAVERFTLYVDGRPLALVRRPPYVAKWDTCAVTPGLHTLVAEAADPSGNVSRVVHNVTVVFAAPGLGKPGPENEALRFGWQACGTPSSYNLYWGLAPGITTSSTRIGGLTKTTYRLTGLTNGTRYWFRVASVVGGVEGPLSNEVVGTPKFQHCSRDGWCFESPMTGAVRGEIISMFAFPTGEVFVGTDDGELFRMDAAGWTKVADIGGARIIDIWGSAPDDVWFTTSQGGRWYILSTQWGAVRRWNGTSVSVELVTQGSPPPNATALWGFSRNDVWVATPGDSRAGMFHWDGATWTPTSGPQNTNDLWGATPNDVWAVGSYYVSSSNTYVYDAFRWDGTRWNPAALPFPPASSRSRLFVSGTNASNVWVAGWDNLLFRYDGTTWSQLTPPTDDWDGVVVRSPTDVSIVSSNLGTTNGRIFDWDGTNFTLAGNRPLDAWVTRIFGGANGELFTAGSNFTVLQRSGGAWTRLSDLTNGGIGPFDGVDSDVWAISGAAIGSGGQRAMLRNTGGWQPVALPAPPISNGNGGLMIAATVKALWAKKTPQCAWAVGGTRDALYFPSRWPEISWAVRWDGTSWRTVTLPTNRMLNGVWGRDCNDVWMVGQGGTMLHWDGATVSAITSNTTRHLWELTGTADGSLYAMSHPFTNDQPTGFYGEPPLKWDGLNWVPIASAGFTLHTMSPLGSTLWTAGSTDFTGCNNNACSGDDVIGRWDGTAWSRLTSPFSGPLFGISAVAPDRVWLLGSGPNGYEKLHRWDGAVLVPEQSEMWADPPATYDSRHAGSIFGTPSGDAWLGGSNGRLLHRSP